MAIEQWGFLWVPHLLWFGASVHNDHFQGPVTLTTNAERLAVELSWPVFWGLFEHLIFRFLGQRSNPLRHRRDLRQLKQGTKTPKGYMYIDYINYIWGGSYCKEALASILSYSHTPLYREMLKFINIFRIISCLSSFFNHIIHWSFNIFVHTFRKQVLKIQKSFLP